MLTATRAIGTARESALSPEQDLADQITLVSWNRHYGVDPAGAVEPEQVARTIEAQHLSVVTLPEVSRGGPPVRQCHPDQPAPGRRPAS